MAAYEDMLILAHAHALIALGHAFIVQRTFRYDTIGFAVLQVGKERGRRMEYDHANHLFSTPSISIFGYGSYHYGSLHSQRLAKFPDYNAEPWAPS
ncbi:hypothetical protein EAE96_011181 [Botrytis aclada]|nr:hypothetical protein EAE96_011181 [Botrytis aclada]